MAKLTALGIKRLTEPGRYGDGGGLWLQVRDPEHRSWLFRYKLHGRARQMGLGVLADTPLADARGAAAACRRLVRDGIDPIDHREARRAAATAAANVYTFKQVAERYIASHKAGWRNEKHGKLWQGTLATYAYPAFGNQPITAVDTAAVLKVLEPIWRTKTETATRVRGRIESVLNYSTAQGWRSGDNPARWRGHLSNLLPAPRAVAKVVHHPALPYAEVAQLIAQAAAMGGTAPLALRFVVLTACRTGEAIGARWREIDLDRAIWTVPAERMKAGRDHRVPLSVPALAILNELLPLRTKPADFVFPGHGKAGHLSNMSLMAVLHRMGRTDITTHGFRSTFRDWCAERTPYPREVAERALAHTLRDKSEAAYQRSDLLEKRAALMADWGEFCCPRSPQEPQEAHFSRAGIG